VFLIFYRAVYVALAVFIAASEFKQSGNLFQAVLLALPVVVLLELLYWLRRLGPGIPSRFFPWVASQRKRTVEDRLYPNVPLLVALLMAIVCIGIAIILHNTFPETCNPEARKWLFRVGICRQPFRAIIYMFTAGVFAIGGLGYLIMAVKMWRR